MTGTASEPRGADEAALLARARQGDPDALSTLLERYEAPLFRFSMRMCRDREDAREILQDSLLAAARSIGDFRGDSALSTWLFTIVRSFCIKRRRRHLATDHPAADAPVTELHDPGQGPDDSAADRELLSAIDGAIDRLSAENREVLLLRDVEGLTAPEVARALGMSVPQVKSRLHRARAAVRQDLTPLLDELHPPPTAPPSGCPDIVDTFSRYLEGEISADLCERMQSHVDGCGHCKHTCDSLKHTLAVCSAVPAPAVPLDLQQTVRRQIRDLLTTAKRGS